MFLVCNGEGFAFSEGYPIGSNATDTRLSGKSNNSSNTLLS